MNLGIIFIVPPSIKEKPKVVKDDKKKTVVMECIIRSDTPPKVQVLKGTETVLEDKKHFAKIEKINEVGFSKCGFQKSESRISNGICNFRENIPSHFKLMKLPKLMKEIINLLSKMRKVKQHLT